MENPEPLMLRCKTNSGTPRTMDVVRPILDHPEACVLFQKANSGTIPTAGELLQGSAAHTCQGTPRGAAVPAPGDTSVPPEPPPSRCQRKAVPLTWHPQCLEPGAVLLGQQREQGQPRGRAQPRQAGSAARPPARRAAAAAGRRAM